ncbi:unnamed protein product [Wuchereria bancrofti]|uniref:Uncharacterized protein n=1 Tax=Wuchereria bancrofti TaxID=6293 RepID=A0A3P7FEZ1_WUCBA|nr:unnamed protein product [Wuchereria bancrofti]
MRYRRRPKKVWTQQTDVYTGLEKSDRELPPSNAINENTKRRKKRFVRKEIAINREQKILI